MPGKFTADAKCGDRFSRNKFSSQFLRNTASTAGSAGLPMNKLHVLSSLVMQQNVKCVVAAEIWFNDGHPVHVHVMHQSSLL